MLPFQIPDKDVSCTLETNDSRTQVRPTLLVLLRRLKEQRSQTRNGKLSWIRVPVNICFCNLKTNDARDGHIKPELFILVRILLEKNATAMKIKVSLVLVMVKTLSVYRKLFFLGITH
jgi:hypothetical protein